ncbi:MAG: DUF5655 domain-containing protein [Nitrososphaeraceae archaeon]
MKVYTEDHSNGFDDNVKELYSELKSAILTLGNDIEMRTTKSYISFRHKHNFRFICFPQLKAYCILIWE